MAEPDTGIPEEEHYILTEWAEQQKKTFLAWCNSHLRKIGVQLNAFEEDFRDGIKLMQLLEIISGETLDKAEKGKMRFHHIANVNKALSFIASKGVKLVSIGAEEIVDGNLKMTLGMIWTIILRFAIQDIQIEDYSAKAGLLVWCQHQVKKHGLKVENFHSSFKDGLVFCAIIHNNRPDLLKYHELKKDNKLANLNLAFDVADKQLDIPPMLDAEDMVNSIKNDERSVMTYVSSYYHKFAGKTKVSEAASNLASILKPIRENELLALKIASLSSELLKWIKKKIDEFSKRDSLKEVAAAEKLQQTLRKFFTQEKPAKLEDKALLETTFYKLVVRLGDKLKLQGDTKKMVSQTQEKWTELEGIEKSFEEWILNELQRLIRLEQLREKFANRCKTYESWAKGKPQYLSSKDYLTASLPEMRAMRKKMEAFRSELKAYDARVELISRLGTKIAEHSYHDMDSINGRVSSILEANKELKELSDAQESHLDRLLPVLENIDANQLDFAKLATTLKNWGDQALEDLCDTYLVAGKTELAKLIEGNETFEKEMQSSEGDLARLVNSGKQITELIKQNKLSKDLSINPYTDVTVEELQKLWSSIKACVPKHQEWLTKEKKRMETNDKLLEDFNTEAKAFHTWMKKEQTAIQNCSTDSKGTLQENRDKLKNMENSLRQNQHKVDELEHSNNELEDAYGLDTRSSTYSMSGLRIEWNQLFTSLQFSSAELENRIQLVESKGLTNEQMEELRDSFTHFDKDKSQRLEPNEFKACLYSVGPKLGNDFGSLMKRKDSTLPQLSEEEFSRIMKEVDPTDRGYATFDAFLNFMAKRIGNQNIEQQIIDSFKILTGEKEYVTGDELRNYLSEEDAEFCLKNMVASKNATGDDEAYDYKRFANTMQTPKA